MGANPMPAVPFRYALITPARNEAAFIEQTIQSVIAQRLKPIKWLIASDGSTDGTDQIVQKYLTGHPWLELMRMPEDAERTFAGKARAFNTGYAAIKSFEFDVIGNLDADITIQDPEYFAFLMGKFAENPKLGVAGTPFVENNETYNFRYASVEHVSGACQLFRRQCLEAIGGYQFLKAGGVDFVAVLSARMHGWQTRSFLEKACFHHRKQGSASRRGLKARLYVGRQGPDLGGHPVWELFRGINHMAKPPLLAGGACMLSAYFWRWLRRKPRVVTKEMAAFRQKDQMRRLRGIIRRAFRLPGQAPTGPSV